MARYSYAGPVPLPLDRPFWADNGYGEIVRLRFDPLSCAPWDHFDQCEDDDQPISDGETRQIGCDEITDWDDDRQALSARIDSAYPASAEAA
jgi:hypothetical protein